MHLLYISDIITATITVPTTSTVFPTQPINYPTQSGNTVVGTGQNGVYVLSFFVLATPF